MNSTKQLSEISKIMADGYDWLRVKAFAEHLENRAESGDQDAQKILDIIAQFHKLCKITTR